MNIQNRSIISAEHPFHSEYSADHLPERERFQYWESVISKFTNPFEITSVEDKNFQAKLICYHMHNVTYTLSTGSSPFAAHLTTQQIAQVENHPYHLIVKLGGIGQIRQGGFEAHLHMGDVTLIDTKQELFSKMEDSKCIILTIPATLIHTWIPCPENYVAHTMHSDRGWASTLVSYLRQLTPQNISETYRPHYNLIIENVLSIYVMALDQLNMKNGGREKIYFDKKNNLHDQIRTWLSLNYMDTEISADKIAYEFGVSMREVHRQFKLANSECTFLETLQSMRLAAAIRMLKDPKFSQLTISEIGFRSGFLDPAYFGRVFKEKTSYSPGLYAKRYR
ncbi:AraC family transcriptional regulator [Glaciimonas sp. PAMC28666]|uniref:helix-turn-helix domain-containing protein n=1 Tax=Glaciimonas sp. PAMC28666 TaxID=2807626 RepID=UPI001963AD17|nr:AraC family transcriptional regulator [Glaciimonas sp. PAMC28666]QRX83410.1 helix-turn-helix transcriptional regulator [Glaciimonas sp. PAMC28666]